jgi:hypothetical protein
MNSPGMTQVLYVSQLTDHTGKKVHKTWKFAALKLLCIVVEIKA